MPRMLALANSGDHCMMSPQIMRSSDTHQGILYAIIPPKGCLGVGVQSACFFSNWDTMNSSINDRPSDSTTESKMASAAEAQQELLRTKGSDWGRRALKGIAEMYRNEEARKEVARRLF